MTEEGPTSHYEQYGWAVLRGVVPIDVTGLLTNYLRKLSQHDRLGPDKLVEGSGNIFGDPLFDTVLDALTPVAEKVVGQKLVPTYSFVRMYLTGQGLPHHTDRPSCQHSMSVCLGSSSTEPWPLRLQDLDGRVCAVDLDRGDLLAYQGPHVLHWRDELEAEWHVQAFLHWIDADGDRPDLKFDSRATLGRAPVARKKAPNNPGIVTAKRASP